MLTTEPTPAMVKEWKRIFEAHRADLTPNRKTGREVDAYFRAKYPYRQLNDAAFCQMVAEEIAENDFLRRKLPPGTQPEVQGYAVGDVLVGLDLNSGEFHLESENTAEMISLHDDLFAYRGLDAADLTNFFLVAEYLRLTQADS